MKIFPKIPYSSSGFYLGIIVLCKVNLFPIGKES